MERMKPRSLALLMVMGLVALTSACTPTTRYVTLGYWQDTSTVYVAYAESDATSTTAKVQRCTLNPDNTVTCADQANVNALLNPK